MVMFTPQDSSTLVYGTSLVRQIVLEQVRALHGTKGGDLKHAQIAVCTIEKANGLVNRMAAADVRCQRHRSCCWCWLLVVLVACETGLAQTVVPVVVPTCFYGVVVGCKCLLQKDVGFSFPARLAAGLLQWAEASQCGTYVRR